MFLIINEILRTYCCIQDVVTGKKIDKGVESFVLLLLILQVCLGLLLLVGACTDARTSLGLLLLLSLNERWYLCYHVG